MLIASYWDIVNSCFETLGSVRIFWGCYSFILVGRQADYFLNASTI